MKYIFEGEDLKVYAALSGGKASVQSKTSFGSAWSGVQLNVGDNKVLLRISGKNASATNYYAGIDCICVIAE